MATFLIYSGSIRRTRRGEGHAAVISETLRTEARRNTGRAPTEVGGRRHGQLPPKILGEGLRLADDPSLPKPRVVDAGREVEMRSLIFLGALVGCFVATLGVLSPAFAYH